MDSTLFSTSEPLFGGARKPLRTRRFVSTAPLSILFLLMLPIISLAQSALTDDACVSLGQDKSNHGASPNLSVSPKENIYLKFNLSSTLPATTSGSAVGRATLKLYAGSVKAAGKLGVYPVLGPWDENEITGANVPPLGRLVGASDLIGKEQEGKFIVIDITTLVRQWLGDDGQGTNGIPNHGLALVAYPVETISPEGAEITFDSKENSQTSHEAQLNVELESIASGLQKVERDATLTGDGVTASPLGVASGGVNTAHLADGAVTGEKIAANAVTSSGLADGVVTSSKIAAPLSLTSADPSFTLSIANTGAGAAITAAGAIDTSKPYNIGGQRSLSNPGTNNLFAGTDAGASNTTGVANAFFGKNAGQANTTGSSNSFVGFNAGASATTGKNNSFFGDAAGYFNAGGNDNSFFGFLAGFHSTAQNNSFFGSFAGAENTVGFQNSFFGYRAGVSNTDGSANAFFGSSAGASNTIGSINSFFGPGAGLFNTAGFNNSFFGGNAGSKNTSGQRNSFFGQSAGLNNTIGRDNVFLGQTACLGNTAGGSLTLVGANTNVGADNLSFATAIGAEAVVSRSNAVVLGRSVDTVLIPGLLDVQGPFVNVGFSYNIRGVGVMRTAGFSNIFVGRSSGGAQTSGESNSVLGASAGASISSGSSNSFFGSEAGFFNGAGAFNTFIGSRAGILNTFGRENIFIGYDAGNASGAQVDNSIVIGVNQKVSTSNTILLGSSAQTTQIPGGLIVRAGQGVSTTALEVAASATGGGVIANNFYIRQFREPGSPAHLCWRVSNAGVQALVVTTCTSSFSSSQLKTESRPFSGGLDIIKRLNPVTFSWKGGGAREIGLNAEDVAEVEPLLITRNDKGEVEDVKENSLDLVFINAFKEQQKQLEAQQEQIRRQQIQIDAMRKLICSTNPQADFCK